jgi:hypothetical protein
MVAIRRNGSTTSKPNPTRKVYHEPLHPLHSALTSHLAFAADNTPPECFRSHFSGKDLTGWTEKKQSPTHWSVNDGELAYEGKGADLFHTEDFANFVLLVDWTVPNNGNSGVFLWSGATQVEINDADKPPRPIGRRSTTCLTASHFRASHFRSAISFHMALSKVRSDTVGLSRAFSFSNSRSLLSAPFFTPPYWLFQRW